MSNVALLVVCFALGIGLRAAGRFPEGAHATINAIVVNVALPALILVHVHEVDLGPGLARAVATAWLAFAAGALFFLAAARAFALSRETTGALILTGGLANTSFVGVPMIEAFYGSHGIALAIVIDQLGSYLILATVGIVVAAVASGGRFDPAACARKIMTFPPLVAVALALALRGVEYAPWLAALLERLGDLVAPLALLSVGYQLRLGALRGNLRGLGLGLAFKLVVAPLAVVLVLVGHLGLDGDNTRITAFEMAMPPMIGAAIVAAEHRLNPPLVALMVGIGIPLSFVTLPLWWFVLARI